MPSSPAKDASSLVRVHVNPPAILQLQLDLSQFQESDNEISSKLRLTKEVFAYFLQKSILPRCDSGVLKPLREFILPTVAQLTDHSASLLYYMELVDENADSEEAMTHVAEMVLEKVQSDSQRYIVLVGDGKTYEHLLKVKKLYGSALERLLIFPGDWHILEKFPACSYESVLPCRIKGHC